MQDTDLCEQGIENLSHNIINVSVVSGTMLKVAG